MPQPGEVLGGERRQGVAAGAGRREQHARPDPGVGEVRRLTGGGVPDAQAQQDARRLAAEGVAGRRDAGSVEPPGEAGDGRLHHVQVVEDAPHVLDARAPQPRPARVVLGKARRPGVEVGGLDHHEAVGGPVVGERAVAVERGAEAVREEDDGQAVPGHRRGHAHAQVLAALRARSTTGLTETTGSVVATPAVARTGVVMTGPFFLPARGGGGSGTGRALGSYAKT
ncbi:hypothetical protein STENM327S_02006 [Streptomyces tendae]